MPNIIIVGEAYGAEEELHRRPFVGPAGKQLDSLLKSAGINRDECYLTNVFNLRPKPSNDIRNLCGPKDQGIVGRPALTDGKFVRKEFECELGRLDRELKSTPHNLILALGNTATWFLLGSGRISKIRGTITDSPYGKVLPTYHPSAVLREWSLRPVTIMDLRKAAREALFPEIRRPVRHVWIQPTLADLETFYEDHLLPARRIAFDIETAGDQITCIGFAPSPAIALVVPFSDLRTASGSYWPTPSAERLAWDWVKRVLALPQPKVGQNFIYDMHFLWRRYGITVNNPADDTMLLHHALHPESEKGLGYLGSIYSNESSWKLMRKSETIKRDD